MKQILVKFLQVLMIATFIVGFTRPITVLADDTEPAAGETVAAEQKEADVPPSATDVPVDESLTVTEETLEITLEPAEAEASATLEPALTGEPVVLADETVEDESPADESLSEIVALLNNQGLEVTDEKGNPVSLASNEAVEVLSYSDPFFWNGTNWEGYTLTGTGCPVNVTCHQSNTPFQAAAAAAPENSTIYVASGSYDEDVTINKANLSFIGFNSVSVNSNATNDTPTVTNPGFAKVRSFTLNNNFGTTSGVYADSIIVNQGGFLSDALNLVDGTNVNATIEANVIVYSSPAPTVIRDSNNNIISNDSGSYYRVMDANDPTTNFEWDCGEPEVYITPGTNYRVTLKNPFNQDVLQYYRNNPDQRNPGGLTAEERMDDLILGANMSEQTVSTFAPWTNEDEKIVYWNLLGHVNGVGNLTANQQAYANYVTNGANDASIDITHKLWFIWPLGTTNANGVTTYNKSPLNTQFTFLKYLNLQPAGCTDPALCTSCPWGEEMVNELGCVPIVCPAGEKINGAGDGCEPIVCPAGEKINGAGDGCEPIVCPAGEKINGAGDGCEPIVCPRDSKLVGNDCKPIDEVPPADGIIPITGGRIIASGLGHSCMTTLDNRVLCWGLNSSGQDGDGTTINRLKPVFVEDLDGVYQLTLGSRHSCALKGDGTVWCWGENSSGQLGNGSTANSSVPAEVSGLPARAVRFTAGQNFTCAVLEDDSIWCWGENTSGQLNDGTKTNQPSPVRSAFTSLPAQISGGQTELVSESLGQVSLWENVEPMELEVANALNISGNRFTPGGCAVNGQSLVDCWNEENNPAPVSGTENSMFVGTGLFYGCSMDINNTVSCWGKNANGELGDGSNDDRENGAFVKNLGPVTALAVGGQHTCVLIGEGTAMCWGSNNYGQLGNNSLINSNVPVYVILPDRLN